MTRNEYNGWTNYETWAVNLWLDNDEGAQTHWREVALRVLRGAKGDRQDAIFSLADVLKEEHEEALPEVDGFASDLLNAAMSEVNWEEIADYLITGAEEEEGAL